MNTEFMISFSFSSPTALRCGPGVRNSLQDIITKEQWTSVGIVIDGNLTALSVFSELLQMLKQAISSCTVHECKRSEPTYDDLEEARQIFVGKNIQAIIGIGGGSAIDMAKAMAVLVNNRLPAIEYRGFNKMTEAVLPIVAIPTTAGTGSEVTPNASFIDSTQQKKMGINGEAIKPRYALLDPELTLTCPRAPTLSAAIDSVVHGVESFIAISSTPHVQLFAREGVARVLHALPELMRNLESLEHRGEVQYGAFLSGMALMQLNGTGGAAAALSYPVGVRHHVEHGIGGAFFLPRVAAFNVRNGYEGYAALFDACDPSHIDRPPLERSKKFVELLDKIWHEIGVPKTLAAYHLTGTDIPVLVEETLVLKGALDQNPIMIGAQELEELLRSACE